MITKQNPSIVIDSIEIEKELIAGLISYPEKLANVEGFHITESDFSFQNKVLFEIISRFIKDGVKPTAAVIISKIESLGIKPMNIDFPTYIQALCSYPVSADSIDSAAKQLKLLSVKKSFIRRCDEVKNKIASLNTNSLGEIIRIADSSFNKHINEFNLNSGIQCLSDMIAPTVEARGNNPVDFIGLKGPFPTINAIYGSLSRDASITMVAARSGVGKTKLGMFYNFYLAEKYNLPILHMDFGEMTQEELIWRAAAYFTNDEVPTHFLETGKWRLNAEYVDKVRKIGLPRAKKIKLYYIDVSDMSPQDIISVMRRYSYNNVGRDNKFLAHYDYLKPFDVTEDVREHVLMGNFIKNMKSFLKNEMPIPLWCSIQQNRYGQVNSKTGGDDTANSIGISDRIYQQTNHTFLFRYKTDEEIANEGIEFGNAKFIFVKHRSLGEKAHLAQWIKSNDGRYVMNYVNVLVKGFTFEDKGSAVDVFKKNSQLVQTVSSNNFVDQSLLL